MKQFLKRLMLGVVTLAMFCCVTPLAFADNPNYYTIYLERQGGIGTPEYVFVYRIKTSDGTENYRISRLPTPTMEGYLFDGRVENVADLRICWGKVALVDLWVFPVVLALSH